jgi:hypothetical protein
LAFLFRNHPIRTQAKPTKNNNMTPSVAITSKIPRNELGCIVATALASGCGPNKPTIINSMPIGTSLDFGVGDVGVGVVIKMSCCLTIQS